MKTKNFIPAVTENDNKKVDYWGVLFISFIFASSMSCFLFANHVDRAEVSTAPDNAAMINTLHPDLHPEDTV